MTDKEKIKVEVERLKESGCASHIVICDTLLAFIDSLQEEPVSIWHDKSEKPKRDDLLIETNDGRIIRRQSINNYGMVKRWAYTSDLLNLDNSCNFGKNLQEEPVSEDLEEAAQKYAKSEYDRKNPATLPERCKGCYSPLMYAFKSGAQWQKEQMMKDAIDGKVLINGMGNPILHLWDKGRHLIDKKVKVIVIKED